MPVVEKIENQGTHPYFGFKVVIDGDYCTIKCNLRPTGIEAPSVITVNGGDSKIDSTYKAIIEFIKWYNQQKH